MGEICYSCFAEKSTAGTCPRCGYDPASDEGKYPIALRAGSILNGRYIVGRVLGQGGFGITYLAQDYQTKGLVAIKEYLPTEFAGRTTGTYAVQVYSGDRRENFEYGKEQFLAEAKTLAEFIGNDHIVRIYSYFEEYGTAYFAMEYIDGESLDDYISHHGGRLSVERANELLIPVMEALDWVHSKGIVHRDIAPDNIIVTKDGRAKLIDFGAARYSTGEKSKSLDVILKHGFAPKEQYIRRGRQGPFTDVYAMAATYYYAITGKIPPDAIERIDEDELIPPTTLGVKMSEKAEDALLKGLEVSASERYQSTGELASGLAAQPVRVKVVARAANGVSEHRVEQPLPQPVSVANTAPAPQPESESQPESEEAAPEPAPEVESSPVPENGQGPVSEPQAEAPKRSRLPVEAFIAAAVVILAIFAVLLLGSASGNSSSTESLWSYSPSTETLYIKYDGPMPDFSGWGERPWFDLKIKKVVIEDGVTKIGDGAFISSDYLTSVEIPDSVKSIGNSAFASCSRLRQISIPDSVTEIGNFAFNCCLELSDVKLSEGLKTIGIGAFQATGLVSVDIPYGVTDINDMAFENCSLLEEVFIPDSVINIGRNAFAATPHEEKFLNNKLKFKDYATLGYWSVPAYYFDSPIEKCRSLTIWLYLDDITSGSPYGNWDFYIKDGSGAWCKVNTIDVQRKKQVIESFLTHLLRFRQ